MIFGSAIDELIVDFVFVGAVFYFIAKYLYDRYIVLE